MEKLSKQHQQHLSSPILSEIEKNNKRALELLLRIQSQIEASRVLGTALKKGLHTMNKLFASLQPSDEEIDAALETTRVAQGEVAAIAATTDALPATQEATFEAHKYMNLLRLLLTS
jgi:hypothetical protein